MEDKSFIWTSERTYKMFDLRFANDWLFKKKKQPWKEFRDILLQNGFPNEMTLDHLRKKWSYTYDCYKVAKQTKNKKWIYYKVFDKHFKKSQNLDRYDSWNDEWRLKLITSITKAINLEEHNIVWSTVETELRMDELPADCCIQDVKRLWHHLQVTFHRKYRLTLKKGAELTEWPLYDAIENYYQISDPDLLVRLKEEEKMSSVKYRVKKIKKEDIENNENEDFHWSRDITETFVQLRLQHEWMFNRRKWAWNDLSKLMADEYGFPKYLTGRMLSHKWSSTYADYQKAKATGNTNWLYYNVFEAYLGGGSLSFDPVKKWSEEWVKKFIRTRTELEDYFCEVERPYTAWREVEKRLRNDGLPIDHSLLDLPEIWLQITKTFRWKRKFADKGILNEKWPYFDAMIKYSEVRSNNQRNEYKSKNIALNMSDDGDMNADDCEDDIKLFDLKKKLHTKPKYENNDVNTCRACGNEDACVNLFAPLDEDGLDLATKLRMICGIEVDQTESFPSQICFSCLRDLENAYKFRKKCQEIDIQLRHIKEVPVKVEVAFEGNDDLQNETSEQKTEQDYHSQDVGVFDNDDNVEDIENVASVKEESKDVRKVINKRIVKRILKKTRKKYTYDYTRVCEVCGKRTRNIRNHMDVHSTEKCYNCDECGKKFKFKSGLVLHRAVHNPTPKKTCEVCGKTFHVLAQYRKHFVYHANERKFSCETCGKAFHTKEILTVHMRMHTDERPFSCPECGKTFRTSGCVSRHRRIVHKKVGLVAKA